MNRRSEIDREKFDLRYLHKLMRSLFPKKNDFATKEDLEELVTELNQFGIITKKELRLFLKKHRRMVLVGEKEPLDSVHKKIYLEMMGEEAYLDSVRRKYWFAYPGIIRAAMGEEFGSKYEIFSNERDGI